MLRISKGKEQALLGAVLLLAAGSVFAGVQLTRPGTPAAAPELASPLPTVEHPLAPWASQTTLSAASADLGSSLALPSTRLVQPSDTGTVWEANQGSTGSGASQGSTAPFTTIAVTFPSRGLIVEYLRPAPYAHPSTGYQQVAAGIPWSQVVSLNGTPALAVRENSDQTRANFGVVAFEVNGSEIRVMGHNDDATLETIAESILNRTAGS